ncbi:twin transmembrane helix small protein [Pelagovum pacificum]|uniref:Twin transmembrane helix small protein n=1 Tax=Pelagovum pacificum TaxID=2588711 RepID=A0A5C5GBB9_9RHOB|nr:twin transmembrane helix small protein [Pelagovum pacificum]QQA42293.1 twin transmembrane helix small protein [Pelagovum pacificum]TNY31377.1 twin transmembrane helix small protein [Pelagovum pacificum]
MGRDPLFIVAAIAVIAVAAILFAGIGNFGIGGDPKRSNKLMQWRIIAQFAAVGLVLLFVAVAGGRN